MMPDLGLPTCETLLLCADDGFLHISLNRPQVRNAMSFRMVEELIGVFRALPPLHPTIRAVVLRGMGGNFCAGGDVKDMANLFAQSNDLAFAAGQNRLFGEMLELAQELPQTVIVVAEGAVLGGGFGLLCASDIAIARSDAQFGLPETGLGLLPAQIAPFVAARIGVSDARMLMLTGARFDGAEAMRLRLVHRLSPASDGDAGIAALLQKTIDAVRRCAPKACAETKLLLRKATAPTDENAASIHLARVLDAASMAFADALGGDEGKEGTVAFIEKRLPFWATPTA